MLYTLLVWEDVGNFFFKWQKIAACKNVKGDVQAKINKSKYAGKNENHPKGNIQEWGCMWEVESVILLCSPEVSLGQWPGC